MVVEVMIGENGNVTAKVETEPGENTWKVEAAVDEVREMVGRFNGWNPPRQPQPGTGCKGD